MPEAGVDRIRVLFVLPSLAGGGAERVIVHLLRHLDRTRFQPLLALVDGRPSAHRADLPADVECMDLGCRRVRYALPALVALVRRVRPDVLLSTLGHLNLALALARPLLPRRTALLVRETVVVGEALRQLGASRLWPWMYRRFYRRCDAVVCQSQDMQRDLVERFAVPQRQTVHIANPVDVERLHALARDPAPAAAPAGLLQFVAAGRLVPQKGFDLLIEALALLDERRVHLAILGEGPEQAALVRQAQALGVADRVRFAGYEANPFPHIAAADLFVLSSRYEGFPNVVLEALACGTPVVALPAPGGVRALLAELSPCHVAQAMTAQALAAALADWMRGARERVPPQAVAPYRVERVVAQYEQLFADAATRRTRRSGAERN